jgi:hypothetical protein
MDIYGLAVDEKLLIEASVGLFFETWLLSCHGMNDCGEGAGVWVGRSILFDWKHYKSLFFEIPLYIR